MRVIEGDCVEAMRELDEASVDAIVTDPPYELGFMSKAWDSTGVAYQVETWGEALRILKPGGHLLAFGGTRTYHRLACAVEDAGFEIRDSLIWLYGSGFPKSLDVSKAIDRAAGVEREVVGEGDPFGRGSMRNRSRVEMGYRPTEVNPDGGAAQITAPATPEAAQWEGWGTALKPSHEPIVVARKPLSGTVAQNVLQHGTGGINVDGCRVGPNPGYSYPNGAGGNTFSVADDPDGTRTDPVESQAGRWPSNVVLSHLPECVEVGTRKVKGISGGTGKTLGGYHGTTTPAGPVKDYADEDGTETITAWECAEGCPVAVLDEQSGELTSGANPTRRGSDKFRTAYGDFEGQRDCDPARGADSGGASRFFYQAKSSRAERNAGLDGFEERAVRWGGSIQDARPHTREGYEYRGVTKNSHPTVKPIDLMRWLVRLVCPPGGTVLDPFLGSGTTGCAAALEGFDFIGIEREPEYVAIATARIEWWSQFPGEDTAEILRRAGLAEKARIQHQKRGQIGLLEEAP